MYGKKVKLRILFISLLLISVVLSIYLILKSLEENVVYFLSPTEIKEKQNLNFNKKIRIGGMVKKDSIIVNKKEIKFTVTDFKNEIIVSYKGTVPNLFAERKGGGVEGILQDKKFFVAKKFFKDTYSFRAIIRNSFRSYLPSKQFK